MSEDVITINKNTIRTIALVLMAIGTLVVTASIVYDMGRNSVPVAAPIIPAEPIVVLPEQVVVPQPVVIKPTSATFIVYQKFQDINGVQWIEATDGSLYRVAFSRDYNAAVTGYKYYAEFTGQVTYGHDTIGSMSYIAGAPIRVYSKQDNQWHNVYQYKTDTWPMGADDMSVKEYQNRVRAAVGW